MPTINDRVLDAFRQVAPTVEAFARLHDLRIERYPKGKSAWQLRFARQQGGEAAIVLSHREPAGHVLDISAVWWLNDLAAQTRRLRSEKIGVYYRRDGSDALERFLDQALASIGRWTEADLGPTHGPYRDSARGRAT